MTPIQDLDPLPLAREDVVASLQAALEEDLGRGLGDGPAAALAGDRTTWAAVPAGRRARGRLRAKAAGVLAGIDVFRWTFERLDPGVACEACLADGDAVADGDEVAVVEGEARALLTAERTALNFVQRLSGIATLTARFVAAAGGRARILDTRKTTPGLRLFEKYAVRCGGGENHRFGLHDEAMVKDNHIDLAGRSIAQVVAAIRDGNGAAFRVTVEARDEAEALAAAAAGADVVLLDNMAPGELERLVPLVRSAAERAVEIEASGGVDLDTVERIARTGVDRISVGALTHSAPALDLSLALEVLA
ncbi:MAG: carboxylating nicotinate-nucleotide diphosphorylase [Planctomycetota bacterium]